MRKVADLVGIPYARHGRDECGLDCFGLIWLIAKRNGAPIEDVWYKGYDPELVRLADAIGLERCEFAPGCVVQMENDGRLHLGYALDEKRMIHAVINEGVIVEDIGRYPVKGYWTFAGGL